MAETAQSFTVTLNGAKDEKPEPAVPEPASVTRTWTNGKETLTYETTAEMLPVHTDDGTLVGHMFALSYVTDLEDKSDRPVTFCWNGGPGGSSAMVNIGGMGPRHVPISSQKQLPCPTAPEDNPWSMLPTTDLVYIDAFGTGYSKVSPNYDAKKVWGVDGDADAFARGIAQWLTTHERWDAPLYLYGESYGTMRNSVLMRVLGERG
ncbi:MAG: peptidase S10, partial [Adlercreutzia sp.]|nr:peptidase S10 [Adlercreutzia sp.]